MVLPSLNITDADKSGAFHSQESHLAIGAWDLGATKLWGKHDSVSSEGFSSGRFSDHEVQEG